MAGDRVTAILLAKSDLTAEKIGQMPDREAWQWLYKHFPPKTRKHKKSFREICFTGFSASARKRLETEAESVHLEVVKSVTKSLRYLVTGPNAGPAKLEKAKDQEVVLMNEEQFHNMLETGDLPI
jgi:NAD-dependent DNA ligase